ncbi:hypothetical protein [Bradyrhizobium sp.]|nr:hypothetical protein [Bradyrhizobium sp.]HEV2156329.1 hypothetical protein [Bradyrhizobium sp.]
MDACWFLEMFVEIAKLFWYDRHPRREARLRRGRPSVPQVRPCKSEETA